jgi:hypothetical protein
METAGMDVMKNAPSQLEIHARMRGTRVLLLGPGLLVFLCVILRATGLSFGLAFLVPDGDTSDFGLFLTGLAFFGVGAFVPDRTSLLFDRDVGRITIRRWRWPLPPQQVIVPLDPITQTKVFADEGTLYLTPSKRGYPSTSLGVVGGADKAVPIVNAWLAAART